MLDKLGILFLCEQCKAPVHEFDVGFDGENCICGDCAMIWALEEFEHWKPLYDGEVQAGLHDPKGNDNA